MFLDVNNVTLYYEENGEGTPLLLLHGNGENGSIFNELVEEMKGQYRCFQIDARGHGQSSEIQEYHYMDMAADLAQFIKKLELSKPIVYGFSDGAIVALLLAIYYPELPGKLVLSGANTNPKGVKAKFNIKGRFRLLFQDNPLERMMLTEPDITKEQLQRINVPALVLVGDRDLIKMSDTRKIVDNIPKCTLQVLRGQNHFSYVIHKTTLKPLIEKFDRRTQSCS